MSVGMASPGGNVMHCVSVGGGRDLSKRHFPILSNLDLYASQQTRHSIPAPDSSPVCANDLKSQQRRSETLNLLSCQSFQQKQKKSSPSSFFLLPKVFKPSLSLLFPFRSFGSLPSRPSFLHPGHCRRRLLRVRFPAAIFNIFQPAPFHLT